MREYRTATEDETISLGEELARDLPGSGAVLLIGNLGAGKTTLAKGLVHGLTGIATEEVSSPTFTLVHEYGEAPRVYHIDLYRLETAREVKALGMDDLLENGLCLIEWGERFPQLWPERHCRIEIEIQTYEDRLIRCQGCKLNTFPGRIAPG